MTPEVINRIVSKLTSGQWLLTMSAAFVFAWCAVNAILDKETISTLLGVIFTFYFSRQRNQTQ